MWIAIGIVVVLVVVVAVMYNSLVRRRNEVRTAWSDIDVQLKRRYDLIPNLLETVKGYAAHESSVFENVTKARTMAMSAQGSGDKARLAEADNMLTGALKSLFAVAENYPQLRASENFVKFQDQLSVIESDIQSARRYYNASTRELNNSIQTFPSNMIAGMFGFAAEQFFGVDEQEKAAPKVSF